MVPSTVSGEPFFIHVTLVAGDPVEVQVMVRERESDTMLEMVGSAEGKEMFKPKLLNFTDCLVYVCECMVINKTHTCTV